MKKQFSHRRNSGNTFSVMLWSFGVVFLIALVLILFRVFLPGALVAAASPFWKSGTVLDATVGNAFIGMGNASKLAQENTSLSEEVTTLQNENAVLATRSQDLTKLLGGQAEQSAGSGANGSSILGGVLARPPESPYDTLIVGSGSNAGIRTSAEVFAAGGIPIGTVKSVTSNSAIVQLLSTPGTVTDGWVGDNRVALTLTGMGAGAFTATLPAAASVSVGDSVYVPGPGAIPLGTIVKIDSDPSSPISVLHIQSLVNVFSLTWVQIGT